jgi:hypothetical protein
VRVELDAFVEGYPSSEMDEDEGEEEDALRLQDVGEELLREREALKPY